MVKTAHSPLIVFGDGRFILPKCVLKQETHFLRDLAKLVESPTCDVLPVPLPPSIARVSPRATDRLIPFKTFRLQKDLCSSSTEMTGAPPT